MHNSTIKPKTAKQKVCLCPCGEKFTPTAIGQKWVNQGHYAKWLTETEAGQKEVAKKMEKAKAQVKKEKDKELNDKINSWKPTVHEKKYKGLLQNEVNKL